ncbi:MAG: transposase [Phycisphaerales bacterium]
MAEPLAYFLTWTCHGTWLNGDERGSVDRDHNQLGTPHLPPDPKREARAAAKIDHAEIVLTPEARALVEAIIRHHCEIRGWNLRAINVRTNHVHVVVDCRGTPAGPETAMEQFKAWCTRRLREAGFVRPDQKVWTEHGSTRWINTDHSLAQAIDYVLKRQ